MIDGQAVSQARNRRSIPHHEAPRLFSPDSAPVGYDAFPAHSGTGRLLHSLDHVSPRCSRWYSNEQANMRRGHRHSVNRPTGYRAGFLYGALAESCLGAYFQRFASTVHGANDVTPFGSSRRVSVRVHGGSMRARRTEQVPEIAQSGAEIFELKRRPRRSACRG